MDKFRDKDGNWRENIQRMEEDIPKFAITYSVPKDETQGDKVKLEMEQEWVEGSKA